MPELYNQRLLEDMKVVQRAVNSAINELDAFISYGPELTAGAKTTRNGSIKTPCAGSGISTDGWLGNDDPA